MTEYHAFHEQAGNRSWSLCLCSRCMRMKDIIKKVLDELNRAYKKWPGVVTDPYKQITIIGEEFGEMMRALNDQWNIQKDWKGNFREEAIQTAAMCIRCLMEVDLSDK